MATVLYTLDQTPEDKELLHDMYRGIFLHGECYAFAIALHQGLGWPMVGLMKGDTIWHAGVRAPDAHIHDIRGQLTEDQFGRGFLSPPHSIRLITEEELYATRPVDEFSIKKARQLAEVLWPALPWMESQSMKVKAFADELENLSRKHGLWICGSVPADPPRLFSGYGDEGGYAIRPTQDGLTHTICRYLPMELQVEARRVTPIKTSAV
jgi:hypothetical protein